MLSDIDLHIYAQQLAHLSQRLADHPLKNLVGFDTAPKVVRRTMTLDEISQAHDVCTEERRLVYEAAFLSGLRANELRNL